MRDTIPFKSAVYKTIDFITFMSSCFVFLPIVKPIYRLDIEKFEKTKN